MDKNEFDDMGISLLLEGAVKKGGGAPARKAETRSSKEIDDMIDSIEHGKSENSIEYEDDGGCEFEDEYDGDETQDDTKSSDNFSGPSGHPPKQPHFRDYPPAQQPPKDPQLEINEKREILYQFDRLTKKGCFLPRQFNMSSDVEEMRTELIRIKRDRAVDCSIEMQRNGLMMLVSGIEKLTNMYCPNKVKLQGWSNQVQNDISSFDDVFEELYEKWGKRGKWPVEVKLIFTLVSGAIMCHIANAYIKDALPGMDQVLKQNPKLVRDLASAAMNAGSSGMKKNDDNDNNGSSGGNPFMSTISNLMSNFLGGNNNHGNSDNQDPARSTPNPQRSSQNPPKMRGPAGFDQMMHDIRGQQLHNNNSSRIETFSTVSDTEISEFKDDAMSARSGGSSGSRRRRIINI